MIVEVRVPALAESIAEATLLQWQKKPGESVKRGDSLIDIETDKVVLEVTSPDDGVLKDIAKEEGASVSSAELIATIDTDYGAEEKTQDTAPPQVMARQEPEPAAAEPALSPAVRRLVAEHALDPAQIKATGRGGRLTKADVLDHMAQAGSTPPPVAELSLPAPVVTPVEAVGGRGERRESMSRLRARVAERLVSAQHNAAMLTTFNEVNMQPVMELRKRYREAFEKAHGARLGFMSFFAKASVLGLQRFAKVNAYVDAQDIVYHDYYDVGIAVGSPRGLVVPVLRDVDRLSFAEIETRIAGFADKAQDGKLSPDDLVGGTFTITNGGVFGSLLSTPILNPPQSAILGMHKIQERPMAENGQVVVRPMMYLALTYDHRIVDGREAIQFLVTIKEAIEDPARMLLEI